MLKKSYLLILMLFLFAVSCVKDPTSLDPQHYYKIAFIHQHSIWIIDEDGSEPHKLNANTGFEQLHQWSPNGKSISFSGRVQDNFQLFLSNLNNLNPVQITNHQDFYVGNYDWSPDGKSIVYTLKNDSRQSELYIINLETMEKQRVFHTEARIFDLLFSPTGDRIIFLSNHNTSENKFSHLYVINTDGTNLRKLSKDEINQGMNLKFSPNRENIFYVAFIGIGWQLFSLNIQSGITHQITQEVSLGIDPFQINHDSRNIIYTAGFPNSQIISINLDGSGKTNITRNNYNNDFPSLSPDGRIAFVSYRGNSSQIYIMNSDGTNERQLTNFDSWCSRPKWCPVPMNYD